MSIPAEAVEAAAKVHYQDGWEGPPFWESLDTDDPSRISCLDTAQRALEAAAPYILQSAAHDLAGADKTSHWDDVYREFEERDGGDLSSDSSAYLDGISDAMRFLQDRARK